MSALYSTIYSQNITIESIDENISKLFDLQFSEFYKNFKNFDVISNFIKYRYESYVKYLEMFKPTSNIFPTLIKYNFGLNQVVNLGVVQSNDLSIYDLITKRGSKSIFSQITKSLGINIAQEDILLVSKNPVRILGADTLKQYPPEYLNYFQDIDEIKDNDLPVKLPVMSLSYDITMRIFDKYDTIVRALLFDDAPILSYSFNSVTLKEYFLIYLLLKQVIYNEYRIGNMPKYINQPVITPVSFAFRYYLVKKYPDILGLSEAEQKRLFLGFMNDYITQRENFQVRTSNVELNDTLNNDIKTGLFITKLNDYVNTILPTTVFFKQDVFKSGVLDKEYYKDYFSLITNTLSYLKNEDDYVYFYSNIIKYLNDNSLVTFISDFSDVCLTIQNALNELEIVRLPVVLPAVSTQRTTDILQTGLSNYYPLYMIIPDPTYEIKFTSSIQVKSGMERFTDRDFKFYHNMIDLSYLRTHFAQDIKELRFIRLGSSYHVTIYVHEFTDILVQDLYFHVIYHVKEHTNIELHDSFHVIYYVHENSILTSYNKVVSQVIASANSTIDLNDLKLDARVVLDLKSSIDIFDTISEVYISLTLTDIIELDNNLVVDITYGMFSDVILDSSTLTAVQNINASEYIYFDQSLLQKMLLNSQIDLQDSNNVLTTTSVNSLTTLYNTLNVGETVVLTDIFELNNLPLSIISYINQYDDIKLISSQLTSYNSINNSTDILLLSTFNLDTNSIIASNIDILEQYHVTTSTPYGEQITFIDYPMNSSTTIISDDKLTLIDETSSSTESSVSSNINPESDARYITSTPYNNNITITENYSVTNIITSSDNITLIDESVTSDTHVTEESTTTISDEDFTITEEDDDSE